MKKHQYLFVCSFIFAIFLTIYTTPIQAQDDFFKSGEAKMKEAKYKEAVKDFDKSIKINPNNAKAYAKRGSAKSLSSDQKGAIADFTKALELDAKLRDALLNRGLTYKSMERYEDAIADFTQYISTMKETDLPNVYAFRGFCYVQVKDKTKACADLKKIQDSGKIDFVKHVAERDYNTIERFCSK